jgi:predicted nucleotidyltransferase component of viral defense system
VKKDIKNIAASVHAKLQNNARRTNRPFSEVLQYYAMERFLYRLSQSQYNKQFILKGALMFIVWQVPDRRTTLDIDLLGLHENEVAKLVTVMKEICNQKVPPDGLVFDANTIKGERIKEGADYKGVRIKFKGLLGRARVPMQIDIAFGDILFPKPTMIEYPVILDFPKPQLSGYSAESIVAEKFESMVKLGSLNSRMKDFYDLWLMTRQFNSLGLNLIQALSRTFSKRKTELPEEAPLFAEEIYSEKSDRQTLWNAFLIKGQLKHAPEKLMDTALIIESFLCEPLEAIHKKKEFNCKWEAPGPWKQRTRTQDT